MAGTFYPGTAPALAAEVEALLAAAPSATGLRPKALIAPHAGYRYSGPVAASAFALLRADARPPAAPSPTAIERVVLLGPAHRQFVQGLAWPGVSKLRTPLGEVAVDLEAIHGVARQLSISADAAAHAYEHSLEVELPFLQRVAPRAKVVPLLTSRAEPHQVAAVLEALWGGPETVVVISSDLSHYLPYEAGRERDRHTADQVLACEPVLTGDDACGAVAINGLLVLARRRELRIELVDLRSSGDTAGPRDEVVGYAAFAVYERPRGAA